MNIAQLLIDLKTFKIFKHFVFIVGNGGSACNAIHFAEDLMGCGIRAIALTDIGFLTATANDKGYTYVFSRPLKVLADPGDMLITLSTSGASPNVVEAIQEAKRLGMEVISFPTNKELGMETPRTEEKHLKLIHDIVTQL